MCVYFSCRRVFRFPQQHFFVKTLWITRTGKIPPGGSGFGYRGEEQIDGVLGPDAGAFKEIYDVTPGGNWEGHTILNRSKDLKLGNDDQERRLLEAREKLLAVRAGRIRPQRDDKVLADWNGLMIAALAKAGAVFGQPAWIETAADVFRFIADTMTENGRLKHSWCAGRLRHPATVDDYAAMARAALVLLGAGGLMCRRRAA